MRDLSLSGKSPHLVTAGGGSPPASTGGVFAIRLIPSRPENLLGDVPADDPAALGLGTHVTVHYGGNARSVSGDSLN